MIILIFFNSKHLALTKTNHRRTLDAKFSQGYENRNSLNLNVMGPSPNNNSE